MVTPPASNNWPLQDAKARLSELVKRARSKPQHISVHGERAVVVISAETYAELTRNRKSLVDYLLEGPAWSDDIVETINDRSRDPGRDIEL